MVVIKPDIRFNKTFHLTNNFYKVSYTLFIVKIIIKLLLKQNCMLKEENHVVVEYIEIM